MTTRATQLDRSTPRSRPAFTLTELLVVISIFVVVLGLAVPVFRVLTGSRSIEHATNILGANVLGVRAQALASNERRGLLFYLDAGTNRVGMIALREVDAPTAPHMGAFADFWLDVQDGAEPVLLPPGVGMQFVTAVPSTDQNRYIGFNPVVNMATGTYFSTARRPGGVVAFEPDGRLSLRTPGIVWRRTSGPTRLGQLVFDSFPTPGAGQPDGSSMFWPLLAFSVFEDSEFLNLQVSTRLDGTQMQDPYEDDYANPVGQPERDEQAWLDDNAKPFLLNRFNGSLIRGE